MTLPNNMLLGVDDWAGNIWSTYKPATDAGIGFAYDRLGQGDAWNNTGEAEGKGDWLYKAHREGTKAAGWLHGTYWVLDATLPWQSQLDWVIKNWPGQPYGSDPDDLPFWVDVELKGNLTNAQLIDLTGNFLGNFEAQFHRKAMIYTGKLWFWEIYMTPLPAWQLEYDFALAQYPLQSIPRVSCTWEELKQLYVPWTQWTPGLKSPKAGYTQPPAAIWQFSGDKFYLPGAQGPLDLLLMSQETLERIRWTINVVPGPEPEPEPTPGLTATVLADVLNVRVGPGTGYAVLGQVTKGTKIIDIDNIGGTASWILMTAPSGITGWCCVQGNAVRYLDIQGN